MYSITLGLIIVLLSVQNKLSLINSISNFKVTDSDMANRLFCIIILRTSARLLK